MKAPGEEWFSSAVALGAEFGPLGAETVFVNWKNWASHLNSDSERPGALKHKI